MKQSIALHGEVPLSAAGQRLDQALAALFANYSRSTLSEWIKQGAVRLDGVSATPRQRLRGGEQVMLQVELEEILHAPAEARELDIYFEDEHLLVLAKPAGLVVHPGAGNSAGTLLNALLHHASAQASLPRAGIVHRLDKDTSGLMVVAKSLPAQTGLVAMLAQHAVERQYLAVVKGPLIAGGTVDAPLGRHPTDRLRQTVRDQGHGRRAVTHYRLRERLRAHSLVQCQLETGRTHQIRVHMAHIGHALVGDPLYGGGLRLPRGASPEVAQALRDFRRQALHAERLSFKHPLTGQNMDFQIELPADMQVLLTTLRSESEAR